MRCLTCIISIHVYVLNWSRLSTWYVITITLMYFVLACIYIPACFNISIIIIVVVVVISINIIEFQTRTQAGSPCLFILIIIT